MNGDAKARMMAARPVKLAQLRRQAIIERDGLRYAKEVTEQFGVSYVTALNDLRAVYGELPSRPTRAKPIDKKRRPLQFRVRLSQDELDMLQAAARTHGWTESDAARHAIVATYAQTEAR